MTTERIKLLGQLTATFARIGAFTFGGGWAMISLIEREVVTSKRWLSRQEFLDLLAVTQALPGILAVNFAAAIGDRMAGRRSCRSIAGCNPAQFRHNTDDSYFPHPGPYRKPTGGSRYIPRYPSGRSCPDNSTCDNHGPLGRYKLANSLDSRSSSSADLVETPVG